MLVNYDIHWNPVRLMQRIGRVEVRAPAPAPAATQAPPRATMSLAEYMRRQRGGPA